MDNPLHLAAAVVLAALGAAVLGLIYLVTHPKETP